ncbi:MAG: hypothetical protein EXS39_05795 [Opitutaceae bacterium]|nr:hypothetical protein [Opitutaceae bacterium]
MPPQFPRLLPHVVLSATTVLFWVGCSTSTYEVKVDAISKPAGPVTAAAEHQSYKLKSKNPALGEVNLRYKEAAEYVKTALSGKGLYEASSLEKADMVVELDYGIDAPRTKVQNVSVPVYAQTGGGVRYDQVPVTDAKGNVSYRTVAVYNAPRTELVGFDNVPRQVSIYEKYLRITARETKSAGEGRPPSEIWSVSVSAEDESKDLRKYLPIMASATADYIGKDSSNQKVVKIKDPSQVVDFIRKGMGEAPTVVPPPKAPPTKI